jgi:hypothetical protein
VKGHGEKLTRKQEQAIAALLTEPTLEQAAALAGVSKRTLEYWLARPDFQAAYRKARAAVLERTVGRLVSGSGRAVGVLVECLESPRPSDRIRAAATLLAHAVGAVEVVELERRLSELEQVLDKLGVSHGTQPPTPPG